MPKIFAAANVAAQSTTADPTEQDVQRARLLPQRVSAAWGSDREMVDHMCLGGLYSINRCQENWAGGNWARAIGWGAAGALGISASIASMLSIPVVGGFVLQIRHGCSPREWGAYFNRTSDGLREDMMLNAIRRLRPEVAHLTTHAYSNDDVFSVEELQTCYAHVVGVMIGLNSFVTRHPHARLRGSPVLNQELQLLARDIESLRLAAGVGQAYGVATKDFSDSAPTLPGGVSAWMIAKSAPGQNDPS